MAKSRAVTRMLAVVLVGLTLGATALAAPTRALGERSAPRQASFLERLLSLFRLDDHEERRSPQGGKSSATAAVTSTGALRPHQTSLRSLDATELE
jgi:hypothetical protein